jgi:hypothetical protein
MPKAISAKIADSARRALSMSHTIKTGRECIIRGGYCCPGGGIGVVALTGGADSGDVGLADDVVSAVGVVWARPMPLKNRSKNRVNTVRANTVRNMRGSSARIKFER